MGSGHKYLFLWCFLITGPCFSVFSSAANRITSGQSIRDGETIVSSGDKFALGFFSPRDSGFRYVGIWYYRIANESVVWVANRESPISGSDGVLTIGNDGNLIITIGDSQIVWSSNVTTGGAAATSNSTAILTDTGNLILRGSDNPNRVLWQSFDHPADTFLPDMQVYMSTHGGERRVFTSWRTATDPSPGIYTMGVDPRGSPQIVIWEGLSRRWRTGHWNGLIFTGVQGMRAVYLSGFRLLNQGNGVLYFTYALSNRSDLIQFRINWEGVEIQERWADGGKEWNVIESHPVEECDRYNHCGPFGKCNEMSAPKCSCMEGFVPKDAEQWSIGNWSGGCVRRTELECGEQRDGFVTAESVKLPDFVDYVGNEDVEECKKLCLENCSCTAYAFVSGINCMMWNWDLVDVQQFASGGSSLFFRVSHSELGMTNPFLLHVNKLLLQVVGAKIISFLNFRL